MSLRVIGGETRRDAGGSEGRSANWDGGRSGRGEQDLLFYVESRFNKDGARSLIEGDAGYTVEVVGAWRCSA